MSKRRQGPSKNATESLLPPLPIPLDLWRRIAAAMELSPQHTTVVEYVLRGMKDQEIEGEMEISHSTLRTYLDRIGLRHGCRGRRAIHRHVTALSHGLLPGRQPKD